MRSPACVAATETTPALEKVNWPSLKTAGPLRTAKLTPSPELALATNGSVAVTNWLAIGGKLMLWPVFAAVTVFVVAMAS